ncbi:MAG: N-acetyltransferase [Candidatus Odinarchaeota archaeon]|nr:N-acetyltransferase [Candidatus Odinarchaeota archaeon]
MDHGYVYTRLMKRLKAFVNFDVVEKDDDKVLRILKTYTPEEFRSGGIASALMKYTIAYAKERGFKIIPVCSFAEWYSKEYKEHADVLYEKG